MPTAEQIAANSLKCLTRSIYSGNRIMFDETAEDVIELRGQYATAYLVTPRARPLKTAAGRYALPQKPHNHNNPSNFHIVGFVPSKFHKPRSRRSKNFRFWNQPLPETESQM